MKVGDKVKVKDSKYVGTIAYSVDSPRAFENRWCVKFPTGQLGDFYESDLSLVTENMTKEIKINVPEGYEIDKENSTFECIKFKKLNNKPRSWSEYKKLVLDYDKSGYASNTISGSICTSHNGSFYIFSTPEEARAFAALGKLIQLRDVWWGDWRPDWKDYKNRHEVIETAKDKIVKSGYYTTGRTLVFPTAEMRDDFYNTFKDLIEEAKMFL